MDYTYNLKFKINLQLFGEGEKTEDATPKRREESRKKGQVPKSQDLPQVSTLLVGIVMLNVLFKYFYEKLSIKLISHFNNLNITNFGYEKLVEVWLDFSLIFLMIVGPILLAVVVTGVLANYLQIGFLFTLEPLKPSFSKINPITGLKNMFSLKKVVELFKTIIKLIIIALYGYLTVKANMSEILKIPFMGFLESFILVFKLAYGILLKVVVALFTIAVADYFYQRWEYEKSIKMSKQEIKEEFKQVEGDPQIKGKIRQMQREILNKKMIQDVPKATVIITNPTHLSLALQYEEGMAAPILLAKGADKVAFRIREIAAENNIPLYENKPLARAMYKAIEVGENIPEEFFQAVAEVISYVYKQKG